MKRPAFWKLIESTRPEDGDCEQHVRNLVQQLQAFKPVDIAGFEKNFLDLSDEAYDARLLEVLWVLTGGGPGDEGLSMFTNWMILRGQKAFDRILQKPEALPELYPPGTEIYCVGLANVARKAYKNATGKNDYDQFYAEHYGDYSPPAAPKGAKRDPRLESEEVLTKRLKVKYPQLWEYEAQYD